MSKRSKRQQSVPLRGAATPPPSAQSFAKPTAVQFAVVYLLALLLFALALLRWRDPIWTYIFFWRYGLLNFEGWATTTSLLTPGVGWALLGAAVWTALGLVLRRFDPLQAFLAHHLRATQFVLAGAFIGSVLLIGLLENNKYHDVERQMGILHTAVDRIGSVTATRPLTAPFDFVYLDANGVDAMYAQLEPSLREQQRTIERGGDVSGNAKLDGGGASVGVSASRREFERSQLQAIDPSAQRRASDVVLMLTQQRRLPIYKDSGAWIMARLILPAQEAVADFESVWKTGRVKNGNVVSTADAKVDSKQRVKQMTDEMKLEFDNLRGQVVVEGPWQAASAGSGITRLQHDFFPSEPGQTTTIDPNAAKADLDPIVFVVDVPERQFSSKTTTYDFRVFGTVLSSAKGRFELKALAVFY